MATLNQTTKPYGYENYRYAVLQYWHFCNELGPETTWQEAAAELGTMNTAAQYWLERLPKREQANVRKQLARDMALCEQGAKFKAPRGHALASKAVELLHNINGR